MAPAFFPAELPSEEDWEGQPRVLFGPVDCVICKAVLHPPIHWGGIGSPSPSEGLEYNVNEEWKMMLALTLQAQSGVPVEGRGHQLSDG